MLSFSRINNFFLKHQTYAVVSTDSMQCTDPRGGIVEGLRTCSERSCFNLQLEIKYHFRPSVTGICETKIKTLYNFTGYKYNMQIQLRTSLIQMDSHSILKLTVLHALVKPEQTVIQDGIETVFADLNKPNSIITLDLLYKLSVDNNTENFFEVKEIIS